MSEATAWEASHRPAHGGRVAAEGLHPLPPAYGEDRLVLLVRDPWWLFAYWEVTPAGWARAAAELGPGGEGADLVLRVYDLGGGRDWGRPQGFKDYGAAGASSWYVEVGKPESSFGAEIGARLRERFVPIARSNVVSTPPAGVSGEVARDWLTVEELYRLFAGARPGGSPELFAAVQRRLAAALGSWAVSSLFSPGRAPGRAGAARGFELVVDAELVLYGSVTDPAAEVTVGGRPVAVRPDGSFTFRCALPDGTYLLPVEARLAAGERRTVTALVTRETF